MDHLDRGDPHPLDAGHAGRLHQQLAEVEPLLRIAVVADADPRHHDLALVLGDAAAYLVEDRRGGPRACAAAHGRDDAVGAVAVAAVLHLHESTRAAFPPTSPWRRARGAAERDLVLEVDARARVVVRCPVRGRDPDGDVLGGAGEGPDPGVDLRELGLVEVHRTARRRTPRSRSAASAGLTGATSPPPRA